jgi:hypothetical protein
MLKSVGNPSTRSGDQTIINGNLIIGTNGKGIDFNASNHAAGMTSELFNDYEEGSWTPTISFSTPGNLNVTYTQQNGKYTKIGRQVFFSCRIFTSSITWTTASGVLQVFGVPFTPNASSPAFTAHTAMLSVWTKLGYTYAVCVTGPSDPTLYFLVSGSNVSQPYLTTSEFVSGVNMEINVNGSLFV